jgi:hypothetical protein
MDRCDALKVWKRMDCIACWAAVWCFVALARFLVRYERAAGTARGRLAAPAGVGTAAVTPPGAVGQAEVRVQCGGRTYVAQSYQYVATCQADLDGDGAVTNGDVSLMLLEFGPCQ